MTDAALYLLACAVVGTPAYLVARQAWRDGRPRRPRRDWGGPPPRIRRRGLGTRMACAPVRRRVFNRPTGRWSTWRR